MAGKSSGTSDPSGRAVPDERRAFSEQREENFPGGYEADPDTVPPGAASEAAGASEEPPGGFDPAAGGGVQDQ